MASRPCHLIAVRAVVLRVDAGEPISSGKWSRRAADDLLKKSVHLCPVGSAGIQPLGCQMGCQFGWEWAGSESNRSFHVHSIGQHVRPWAVATHRYQRAATR